jgi:lipoate-protein ligase B
MAERRAGFPGVWVGSRKIASIGVYVKRWITRHGLALNVDVNKCHFGMINPCGMNIEVVSLNELTEEKYSLAKVRAGILSQMEQLFGWRLVEGDAQQYWEKDW